jgi:hypothetical protein
MHAVVVSVTINDLEAAVHELRERVAPRVSEAPGFIAGYWVDLGGDRGTSIIVFESEEAARTAADQVRSPEAVSIDSVTVGEVVVNA